MLDCNEVLEGVRYLKRKCEENEKEETIVSDINEMHYGVLKASFNVRGPIPVELGRIFPNPGDELVESSTYRIYYVHSTNIFDHTSRRFIEQENYYYWKD